MLRFIASEREALWRRVAVELFHALGSPQLDYPAARAQQIFNSERDINPGFANRLINASMEYARSLRLQGVPLGHTELTEELNAAAAMLDGIRRQLALHAVSGSVPTSTGECSDTAASKKVPAFPDQAPPPPPETTAEPSAVMCMNRLCELHEWRGLSLRALEIAAENASVRLRCSTISHALRSDELIDGDLLDRFTTALAGLGQLNVIHTRARR